MGDWSPVLIPAGQLVREGGQVVTLRAFALDRIPVTQALWEHVTRSNPSRFKGPERPVENVSWHEAVAFCNALSAQHGLPPAYSGSGDDVRCDFARPGFRLPTEAEWEYACRAGTRGDRYGEVGAIAWTSENSGGETHPVGQMDPNLWGLFDMLGNVWEWCWDWYGDYPSGRVGDYAGPRGGSGRVGRGGSWYYGAGGARAAYRNHWSPGYRVDFLGFRLSRLAP